MLNEEYILERYLKETLIKEINNLDSLSEIGSNIMNKTPVFELLSEITYKGCKEKLHVKLGEEKYVGMTLTLLSTCKDVSVVLNKIKHEIKEEYNKRKNDLGFTISDQKELDSHINEVKNLIKVPLSEEIIKHVTEKGPYGHGTRVNFKDLGDTVGSYEAVFLKEHQCIVEVMSFYSDIRNLNGIILFKNPEQEIIYKEHIINSAVQSNLITE